MNLVGYIVESFMDAAKRMEGRMSHRNRRKIRRGEKMQKFMDKIDPSKRTEHAAKGTHHGR